MNTRIIVRAKAVELLEEFNINEPPVDVAYLADKLGIKVSLTNFVDDISGLIVKEDNRVILGVNNNHSENRQRFTIAHEIGHFILHITKSIYVDETTLVFRNKSSKAGTSPEEIEANTFAAELLMPESFISQDIYERDVFDESTIQSLSKKYKVSVEALIYRLSNLGYVLDL